MASSGKGENLIYPYMYLSVDERFLGIVRYCVWVAVKRARDSFRKHPSSPVYS